MNTQPEAIENSIALALQYLRLARECTKSAGAPKATAAIRRAMKSTEGAQRHASRGDIRAKRQLYRHVVDFRLYPEAERD